MEPVPLLPDDEASLKGTRDWPHAPPHRLQSAGVFFLTSRAHGGRHLLMEDDMKDWFQDRLFSLAVDYGWRLEAWAILSNHYHLIGHSPPAGGQTLRHLVTALHSLTTKERNRRDGAAGRNRLWHNTGRPF
jgi:putative transposase